MTVLVAGAALMTLAGVGIATVLREPSGGSVAGDRRMRSTRRRRSPLRPDRPVPTAPVSAPTGEEVAVPAGFDNAIAATDEPDGCRLTVRSMGIGKSGPDVECLQKALADAGYYTAADQRPVRQRHGRGGATACSKSAGCSSTVWPGGRPGCRSASGPTEQSLVVRTPPPPEGAEDRWGFELSPVAVSGDDPSLPPLPADSGSGRRVVYDRAGQRVWAVDEDDQVIRSWLVSGSQYDNEVPGTHEVFSRSEQSSAWNGKAILPLMIRWYPTDIGNLGFHGIPIHVENGEPYQTTDELGTRLSGGCQRQHDVDAAFMWEFATVGTTVVVT